MCDPFLETGWWTGTSGRDSGGFRIQGVVVGRTCLLTCILNSRVFFISQLLNLGNCG